MEIIHRKHEPRQTGMTREKKRIVSDRWPDPVSAAIAALEVHGGGIEKGTRSATSSLFIKFQTRPALSNTDKCQNCPGIFIGHHQDTIIIQNYQAFPITNIFGQLQIHGRPA